MNISFVNRTFMWGKIMKVQVNEFFWFMFYWFLKYFWNPTSQKSYTVKYRNNGFFSVNILAYLFHKYTNQYTKNESFLQCYVHIYWKFFWRTLCREYNDEMKYYVRSYPFRTYKIFFRTTNIVTSRYSHIGVRIRRWEMSVFRKIFHIYGRNLCGILCSE